MATPSLLSDGLKRLPATHREKRSGSFDWNRAKLKNMRYLRLILLLAAALIGSSVACGAAAEQDTPTPGLRKLEKPPMQLSGGASSIDELGASMLGALATSDKDALHALRLTRDEYIEIIVPGFVPVGSPPRNVDAKTSEFYWNLMDTKAKYYVDALVKKYGNKKYESFEWELSKGTYEHPWYRDHSQLRIKAHDSDQVLHYLAAGSVAEVDGKYKLHTYEYDD